MRWRVFLQLRFGTAAARPLFRSGGMPSFKVSVRVEPLFKGLTLEQQMANVAEAQFHGFEFGNWRAADPAVITPLKNKLGIECACIVGNRGVNPKGMTLTDPKDREGFLAEIR